MQETTSFSAPAFKDFFLSYSKEDLHWAEWIAVQLEVAAYSTILQARDFRPGFNYIQEMHEAALVSRRTMLLLSPGYLHELETHPEWSVAFLKQMQGQKDALLPIRVRDCILSGLLAPIITLDLYKFQDENVARQVLLDGLQVNRSSQKGAPLFPGAAFPAPVLLSEDMNVIDDSSILTAYPLYPQKFPPIHRDVQIFLAYAAEDEIYARELAKHLSVLQRLGVIAPWAKWKIQAGQEHEKEILSHLERADILLLLISADFFSCGELSLFEEKVVAQNRLERTHILPIILRPADWLHSSFGHLAHLPEGGKPITCWSNQDAAFLNVVNGIRSIINQFTNDQC